MAPKLTVSPNPALVDESLSITVTGLQPGQDVTLRSRVDEGGHRFYGCAHYTADNGGMVKVSNMPSHGGTYRGI